jgi:predicted DCC family thiol-disulfide oxidoreductase YuxK
LPGSKTSSSGSAERWILYDADCGVCKVILARVLELDRAGRYRPLALQDPRAAELLPGLGEEERMGSFHIVDADGTVHSAGDGLAELVPLLDRAPGLARRLYWLVAGNRGALGKLMPAAAKRQAQRRIDAASRQVR